MPGSMGDGDAGEACEWGVEQRHAWLWQGCKGKWTWLELRESCFSKGRPANARPSPNKILNDVLFRPHKVV